VAGRERGQSCPARWCEASPLRGIDRGRDLLAGGARAVTKLAAPTAAQVYALNDPGDLQAPRAPARAGGPDGLHAHDGAWRLRSPGSCSCTCCCLLVLPYSHWHRVAVCLSESLAALRRGVQRSLFQLGRVPRDHQTHTRWPRRTGSRWARRRAWRTASVVQRSKRRLEQALVPHPGAKRRLPITPPECALPRALGRVCGARSARWRGFRPSHRPSER
jgi:hypothetical protein